MEKLDKVIAGMEACNGVGDDCNSCPYAGEGEKCSGVLWADVLGVLKELSAENDNLRKDIGTLSRINADWRAEVGRLHKRIDDARAEGMRVSGVAEKPGTNYQKLVKMGPFALADWIYKKVRPCECCDHYGVCGIPEDEVNDECCLEHILMWLAQEVTDV